MKGHFGYIDRPGSTPRECLLLGEFTCSALGVRRRCSLNSQIVDEDAG